MFCIRLLDPTVERGQFCSGSEPLDRYFRDQVTQDMRRRVTSCFVALDETGRVGGFYTLAATGILLNELPASVTKRLPRYPLIPAVRMGRLAVDRAVRGCGLGAALLADALMRSSAAEIAAFALVVDAKDGAAAAFYEHHGFVRFASQPRSLFLALASAPR
jgi:ribosomal protein S18 acetylase RimI-like enzyme